MIHWSAVLMKARAFASPWKLFLFGLITPIIHISRRADFQNLFLFFSPRRLYHLRKWHKKDKKFYDNSYLSPKPFSFKNEYRWLANFQEIKFKQDVLLKFMDSVLFWKTYANCLNLRLAKNRVLGYHFKMLAYPSSFESFHIASGWIYST